ncbi:MAG: hypothetical protein JO032_12290 [Alphaproteobacteria bacterium]|nr:hypothetical protein [Alphaproteobacteria bacterium]MBV9553560.1 hypothetical protein [Alphaproteobacteria bacterium]MBV9965508.1 hypothetical protein [Alphaproteobacteria bacterium]
MPPIGLLYTFSGFCVSLLVGMTEVGGSSLMSRIDLGVLGLLLLGSLPSIFVCSQLVIRIPDLVLRLALSPY